MISAILLIIITVFRKTNSHRQLISMGLTRFATVPPVGVYLISGCGADLLINICLTLLG